MQLQPGFLRSLVAQIKFDRNVRADGSVYFQVKMKSPVTGYCGAAERLLRLASQSSLTDRADQTWSSKGRELREPN